MSRFLLFLQVILMLSARENRLPRMLYSLGEFCHLCHNFEKFKKDRLKWVLCRLFLQHFEPHCFQLVKGQLFNAYPNQMKIPTFSCKNNIGSYGTVLMRKFEILINYIRKLPLLSTLLKPTCLLHL